MAVPQARTTRSKRGMRRAHDSLGQPTLSVNEMGETHRRHHISKLGYYRGRQVIKMQARQETHEHPHDHDHNEG